jgi:hypothetical protein
MQRPSLLASLRRFFATADDRLSRKTNMFTFLLIRFLLMSAMVVGFSWYAFDVHP